MSTDLLHDRAAARPLGAARRTLVACVAALIAATPAACTTTPTQNRSSACGTLPRIAPQDPEGILATISRPDAYDGWPYPLRRSLLADWRPAGTPPYTVGVLYDGNTTSIQAESFKSIQALLRRSPMIGKVLPVATEPGNPSRQVQAYQSMIDQGADLIVLQPASAPAFTARIRAALDRGVATLAITNVVDDAALVSLAPNVHTSGGAALAQFVKLLGGKGDLLGVHGIRTAEADRASWVSFRQVLAQCPQIELAGEIDGNFAPPAVRAAVLQYLATHPGKIDGVFQTAVMGSAIIGAFQQAGRPVPPVTAMAAQKGELAYWAEHAADGYASTGYAGGSAATATTTTRLVLRMLAGQGPKINMVPLPRQLITGADLARHVQPGWTLSTPGDVDQDPSTYWTDTDLDTLFHHPDRTADTP
ncbi:MAG TPA: substrate-binding domain-containing protein [Actinoplanes sp.]|nr:substrate-binding domain-containing protein [Actinoplanes sp.]